MKTLASLRKKARRLNECCFDQVINLADITVSAKDKSGSCYICKGPMKVQKSVRHTGRTIEHGTFMVNETVHICASRCRNESGILVTKRARSVSQVVISNRTIGYDLIVIVGIKRFLEHKQREEIKKELNKKHGITVSSGEISNMAKLFLNYFLKLHHDRADQLRTALESDGGWPMHVDATGENGRGTLLIVMAGWRRWVLGAWKIATERSELILPCLYDTVQRFGPPCAAMRDLGRAVTPAIDKLVSELELTIPVLACHQHFLADIGKDLLAPDHSTLRELFRRIKVRPKINCLVRELGRKIGFEIDDARQSVLTWQTKAGNDHILPSGQVGLAVVRALAQWILDFKADLSGLDFPFGRPYLSFYDRCITAKKAVYAFVRSHPDDKKVFSAVRRLGRVLDGISHEESFHQPVKRLRRRADLFDEMRSVLRLAKDMPEKETTQGIDKIHNQFEQWVLSLEKRRPKRGPAKDMREAFDIILKHVKTHGENLWGHAISLPEKVGGGIRLMDRTNDLAENFFGTMKHGERRRSGRKNLTQDLEHIPAEAALVYNLNHPDYVDILCGSLDKLPTAFAQLDLENQAGEERETLPKEIPDGLKQMLQLSTASLSSADRRVIRTDQMSRRINNAAQSRAPHVSF